MRSKKSLFYLLIFTLFLPFNLISCGGGGGGGGTVVPTTVSGFIKIVEATGTGDGANIGTAPSARYMMLYLAQDIQASGMISVISLKRSDVMSSSINCPNVTVKMGHTEMTGLIPEFADNIEQGQGAFITVINNASINIAAGAEDTYFDITLPQPFNYNGVDNLIVEISRTSACTDALPVSYHEGYDGANMHTTSSTAGTGTVFPYVVDARFVFSGGDNIAVYADGASSNAFPFTTDSWGQKVQLLYTAEEINGSGNITGIAFPVSSTTTAETYIINVRIGHSTLSQLTDTYANNFNSGSPVTVASSVNFSVPAGVPAPSYIWIPMPDGPFNYNGTDNLVVEIEVTTASGGTFWRTTSATFAGRRVFSSAGVNTGDVDANQGIYGIKFRFAGGTMDAFTIARDEENGTPFFTQDHKLQFLYRAAELGTAGSISRVAFRLSNDSIATSYNSFTVVMGHTVGATLATTFANNMTDAQTVYSGTFNIPAGLKAGDWIEIPLSSPFAYDGSSNLVVQTSSLAGSNTNAIVCDTDALYSARMAQRVEAGANTATTAAGTYSFLADMRFTLQ